MAAFIFHHIDICGIRLFNLTYVPWMTRMGRGHGFNLVEA
jgi:hypothetical protein